MLKLAAFILPRDIGSKTAFNTPHTAWTGSPKER